MTRSHPDGKFAEPLNMLRYVTYSGLAFHAWEWASGLSFEVNHIWTYEGIPRLVGNLPDDVLTSRKPNSSIVKWQYLCSRYLGIAGQIINSVMTGYLRSSHVAPRRFCLGWFIEQMVISQVLLLSLEVSLIHRLYALSGSNSRLRKALSVFVFAEHAIYLGCLVISLPRVELVEACIIPKPPIELGIISGAVGVTQCILWGLTIRSSWRKRAPLSSLMMRDGSWVFGLVSDCEVLLIGGTVNMFATTLRPAVNPFSGFLAVIVNANCRLIINLEDMPRRHRDATSIIELTSYFDIGEYSSEVQCSHSSQSSIAGDNTSTRN